MQAKLDFSDTRMNLVKEQYQQQLIQMQQKSSNITNMDISNHPQFLTLKQQTKDMENDKNHQQQYILKMKTLQMEHLRQIQQKENEKMEYFNQLSTIKSQMQRLKQNDKVVLNQYHQRINRLEQEVQFHKKLVEKYHSSSDDSTVSHPSPFDNTFANMGSFTPK